ncbi:MAG: Golgi transport complex subunit 6 [Candelina mexicana]|nr:MAG: Golgi transport complex subunit 6 [Candelina mexicana]
MDYNGLSTSTAALLSPSVGGGTRSSALSNKLISVLSTSYADLEIRDALEILDARGIANTQETRRHLRLDVQREVIDCNAQIVEEFGQVAEQLKRIGSTVASLQNCCKDMRQHISMAHLETAPILDEASSLMGQQNQVDTKQKLLDAFVAHFTISNEELTLLTSSAEPLDDRFFRSLSRIQKVHKDCQVLLGSENQRLGLEIMGQSSKTLNGAFQRLYRWVQREFRTLDLENPQISSPIRRALRVLAERPSLFESCLDAFAEAREQVLSDSFYKALTGSATGTEQKTSTKPIELFAYDPLRYVGDMLAWAHSATVSEREALEVLFVCEGDEIARGIQAGRDTEPWLRAEGDEGETFDGRKALEQLVNRNLAGVARVARQRIEQVIHGHEDPILAYKLANLTNFYRLTFARLLGNESSFLDTLATIEESAMRQFRATMRDNVTTINGDLVLVPADFAPPEFLQEALEQLEALMKSYDSTLTPESSREGNFQPILVEALDPFVEGCYNLATHLKDPVKSIFVLNCLMATKSSLSKFSFTSEKVTELNEMVELHAEKLAEYQHAFFLHASGLHPLITTLATLSDDDVQSVSSMEPFQAQALTLASQKLDDFLPSALSDATEHLKRLQNLKMAQELTEEGAGRFCEDFEFVERKILAVDEFEAQKHVDEEEEVVTLRSLFPRTSGEIRVLLS